MLCGVPDMHAAMVGSGAVAPYETHVAISTTSWLSARVPFKRTDIFHQIATLPGLDPGFPIVANNQETGGAALRWLREQIVAPNDGLLGGGSGIGAERGGGGVAGAVLRGPAPPGRAAPRPAARACSSRPGWTASAALRRTRPCAPPGSTSRCAATASMLVRSVLEGVAFNARWLFDAYEKFLQAGRCPRLRILGGGAQSDLWCQIYADVLGRPVEQVADPRNAQLRGVALWARMCLGELRLEDVPALVPVAGTFVPSADARDVRPALRRVRASSSAH